MLEYFIYCVKIIINAGKNMITEINYKNNFKDMVLKDSILINQLNANLKKLKNIENIIVSNKEHKGYIFEDVKQNVAYLILEDSNKTTVYKDNKEHGNESFIKFIEGDKLSLKYNYEMIISLFNSQEVSKKNEEQINKVLNDYDEQLRPYVKETLMSAMELPQEMVNVNPYHIKMFLNFLEKNDSSINFNKEFLYKNPELYNQVQQIIPEFAVMLKNINKVLKINDFNDNNKFQYNDADNYVWKSEQYIISQEQNFSWVTDLIDSKNFTIYSALHPYNGNGSKVQSLTDLLNAVNDNKELEELDYVALKVKNGNVIYANNSFMYSLNFNVMLNQKVLNEENLKQSKNELEKVVVINKSSKNNKPKM